MGASLFQLVSTVATDYDARDQVFSNRLVYKPGNFAQQLRLLLYLGAITDEEARNLTVNLDFLEQGRTYKVKMYRDAADAPRTPTIRHI